MSFQKASQDGVDIKRAVKLGWIKCSTLSFWNIRLSRICSQIAASYITMEWFETRSSCAHTFIALRKQRYILISHTNLSKIR